jgi:uncharacterized membrane protein YgdD (TMEM256/DUF423 family)
MRPARYKLWLVTGAVFGAMSIACGAFGAHRLKQSLSAEQLAIWETAARYQMYQALALLVVGILSIRGCRPPIHCGGATMAVGSLIFSGCLYALALGGPRWLGAVVPFGGALMIVGWLCLAIAVFRQDDISSNVPR